jgi:hypothetical protein
MRNPNAESLGLKTESQPAGRPQRSLFRVPRFAFRVGSCFLFSTFCFAAFAQYSIDWSKIAGGGGTSTNGQYSLSGTLGQPDAGGPMTNGQYSVTGGFWALPQAVQVEGAPTLTITKGAPGFATISWTPASTNWVLQEALAVTGVWTNSPSGWTNPVSVPATPPRKFYRLFKL